VTRVNKYLWQLPHEILSDDPPEIARLQSDFNNPLINLVDTRLSELGYELTASEIHVPPDKLVLMMELEDTFKAHVRYIKYLPDNVITRIHFDHDEWSLSFSNSQQHIFVVNLDRFRLADVSTRLVDRDWDGRKHTQVSRFRDAGISAMGDEGRLWYYTNYEELVSLMAVFLDKFTADGQSWLEG